MPANVDPDEVLGISTNLRVTAPEAEAVTLSEQLGGALGLENTFVSVGRRITEPDPEQGEEIDPRDHLLEGEDLMLSEFAFDRTLGEMARTRTRIKQEQEMRRLLGEGPLNEFVAVALAVMSDPLTYIPFLGQFARGAKVASTLGKGARLSGATAGEVAVAEGVLQATQQTRTMEETVASVLLGGALGFGIGAGGARIARARTEFVEKELQRRAETLAKQEGLTEGLPRLLTRAEIEAAGGRFLSDSELRGVTEAGEGQFLSIEEIARLRERFSEVKAKQFSREEIEAFDAAVEDLTTVMRAEFPESTVGAAQVVPIPAADSLLALDNPIAKAVAKGLEKLKKVGLAAPALELLMSPAAKVRETLLRLVDPGLVTKGMVAGRSPGVPVEIRIRMYDRHVAEMARGLRMAHKEHKRLGGRLSKDEFYQEVGRALRRGDQSTVPGAGAMAKELRQEVFDPLKDEAVKLNQLPEGVEVDTALSYLTRVYNRNVIRAKEREFLGIVEGWLRQNIRAENLEADAEYAQIARDIMNTILGNPAGRVPFVNVPRVRGPLKERTFNIPDALIEDFLESNVMEVGARYIRTMAADLELTREFGRADSGESLAKDIQDDFDRLIEVAKTDKERLALRNQADREMLVVKELYNRIRGTNALPEDAAFMGLKRVGKLLRTLNFTRLLGSVLISSIPDLGRVVMEEGLARTMGTLFRDMTNGFRAVRMGIKEAQRTGTALDIVLSQRARAVMDLGERFSTETQWERNVDTLGQQFGNITLLNPWNTVLKGMTSVLASDRILRTVRKLVEGKELTSRENLKLAKSRITPEMARKIAKQAEHWDGESGLLMANTEAWADPQAVEAMRQALITDVNNTIITPGAGDAPLWTSTEWGKTVFQFKKFGMASTQRMLISGLQTRDAAALNGVVMMVAIGVLGTRLRDVANGRDRERSVRQWIVDGVDRSGVLSMFYEFDALSEKFTGVSPTSLFSGEPVSRFAARDPIAQLAGPTAGLITDMASTLNGLRQGRFTQSDLHRLRRLAPFQNHFALSAWLSALEEGAGLPQRQAEPTRANRFLPPQP